MLHTVLLMVLQDPLKSSRTLYMRSDIGDDSLGKDTRDGSGDDGSRGVVELEQGQNVVDEFNKDVSRSKGSANQDLQKKKQGGTLYNEINHNELREYEAQLENQQSRDAEWDNSADGSATGTQISGLNVTIIDKLQPDEDEYDDDGGDGDDGGVERKGGSNNVADDKVQSNEELQTTEGLVGGSGSEHDEPENVHASLVFPKPEQKSISRLNLDNNLSSLQIQKKRDVDVKVNKVPETLHSVVQKSSRGKKKSKHSPSMCLLPCLVALLALSCPVYIQFLIESHSAICLEKERKYQRRQKVHKLLAFNFYVRFVNLSDLCKYDLSSPHFARSNSRELLSD